MSLQPFYIAGYREESGLETDKKPFLLPDQAFTKLENAYVWRERVLKRVGNKKLGRLRRVLTAQSGGNITLVNPSPNTFNLFTLLGINTTIPANPEYQPNAEIQPGSVANPIVIIIGPQTLTDNTGTGVFSLTGVGNITSAIINYTNGNITVYFGAPAGPLAVTITLNYFPSLPVMGIWQQETTEINNEPTIIWDTVYSYIFSGDVGTGAYQLFDNATTWNGTDSDFFWAVNYRGATPQSLIMFATNFINNSENPIRYTTGAGWQDFWPRIDSTGTGLGNDTHYLTQARILIPYYGRMVALNVWESPDDGSGNTPNFTAGINIYNRCRFSQIGSPIATGDPTAGDTWRSDQFGKGGFIDAPTAEAIIGAQFFKNTLIVFFERSTWQLRYVGEYGLPFLWERISSDFGSESTFSPILFDDGVLAVGDKAIITSNGLTVQRIDQKIPDFVFLNIRNDHEGTFRVQGVRDFQKQIVYWCYSDVDNQEVGQYFPNKVLLANYQNSTFAIFRDNSTTFGEFQAANAITWDRLDIFWDDTKVTWDSLDAQSRFPSIIKGNQQGYVHIYQETTEVTTQYEMSITGVDLTTSPIQITVPNHNLLNGELIYINGLQFIDNTNTPVSTDLNDRIFAVELIDINTLKLLEWDGSTYVTDYAFTPDPLTSTYVGGGEGVLLTKMVIETKDFNPYAQVGRQFKLSRIDFQTDATENSEVSVQLFLDSAMNESANVEVGNRKVETSLPSPYYPKELSYEYGWHSFYSTLSGQYLRIVLTYNDDLMNQVDTHENDFQLNAMTPWFRPGGKITF